MKQLSAPLEAYYQHIELLHQGATVVTYAAEQLQSSTAVVIKMLDFKKIQAWKALELFEREVTVLQGLSHSAIPDYIDAFQADYEGHSYYCLVQTRVQGQTLQQWIDAEHRFIEPEIKSLATQLLAVLVYLHGFNPPIIHRDIKPDNLIWHSNILSVLDFGGVLKHLGPAQSTVVGTYGYMAPEQFQGKARVESDLYSVGMTLAHALSHVHPSGMESYGLSINISPYLQCSDGLLHWLRTLTALVPEERFQSARQALTALSSLGNDKIQTGLRAPRSSDALALDPPKDSYNSSASSHLVLSPPKPPSALALTGYILEKHPQKTLFKTQGKNAIGVRTALQIDLFVSLPAVIMLGVLKLVGYTWLMSALLPSALFLPIVAFFLLMARFSQLELQITPQGWTYKKRIGSWTVQTNQGDLNTARFRAYALGASIKKPSPESPAALGLIDETIAGEKVVHMGLPLEAYAYIADTLNADLQAFIDSESDHLLD